MRKRQLLAWGAGIILILALVLQFTPQIYFRPNTARATDITALTGVTGQIGDEDVNWGDGQSSDTFTVTDDTGTSTVTLTKVPALAANIASVLKGQWYVSTSAIADHSDAAETGSIAWVIAELAGDEAVIELPPGAYPVGDDLTSPATVVLKVDKGALLTVANTKTLTINRFDAGPYHVFAGSGAVSFADGAAPEYYAEWFGAVGDGATNDAAAFTALDYAEGGHVRLLEGKDYYINTAGGITFTKALHLTGKAEITCGTTIGQAGCVNVQGDNSIIEDITVNGDDSGYANGAFDVELRRGIKVTGDNVTVRNTTDVDSIYGITFETVAGGEVTGCKLSQSVLKSGQSLTDSGGGGIVVSNSTGVNVHHNDINGYIEGVLIRSTSYRTKVHDNDIYSQDNNGIYSTSSQEAEIHDNTLRLFDDVGIKCRGYRNNIHHNTILGDNATTGASAGVTLAGDTSVAEAWTGEGAVVNANIIYGDFDYGVSVQKTTNGHLKDFIVSDNQIRFDGAGVNPSTGLAREHTGIRIAAAKSYGAQITGNIVKGQATIISLIGTAAGLSNDDLLVANNYGFGSTEDGIVISYADNARVYGNVTKNAAAGKYGFILTNVTNSHFYNNDAGDDQAVATQSRGFEEVSGCSGNKYINNNTDGTILMYNLDASAGSTIIVPDTVVETLAGHRTFFPGEAKTYIFNPDSVARNIIAGGYLFGEGEEITVINAAADATTITFDSAGIAEAIAQNERGIFIYNGTSWVKVYVGS